MSPLHLERYTPVERHSLNADGASYGVDDTTRLQFLSIGTDPADWLDAIEMARGLNLGELKHDQFDNWVAQHWAGVVVV